jgi:hypothetical protein
MDKPIIACDMTNAPDTPAERIAEYRRLFGQHLAGRNRSSAGRIRFRLRAEEGVEAWVRDLAAREKACCPFFEFSVSTVDGVVQWDVAVPDDEMAHAVLDEFDRATSLEDEDWDGVRDRLSDLGFPVTTRDAGAKAAKPAPSRPPSGS